MKMILISSLILTASNGFAALTPATAEPVAVSPNWFTPAHSVSDLRISSVAELPGGVSTAAQIDIADSAPVTPVATALTTPSAASVGVAPVDSFRPEAAGPNDFGARLNDPAYRSGPGIQAPVAGGPAASSVPPALPADAPPGAFTVLNVEETGLPTSRTERDDNDLRFAFHAGPAPALSLLEVAAIGALAIGALCGLAVVPRSRWHWRRWRLA